jgi:hypothetical protein
MDSMHRWLALTILSLGLAALPAACGRERESNEMGGGTTAEAPSKGTVAALSAEGRRCIELVKAKRYGDAIEPCSRAAETTANTDVKDAYAEAKAALQKQAQAAAARAAQESVTSGNPKAATKDAAADALKNLSGE